MFFQEISDLAFNDMMLRGIGIPRDNMHFDASQHANQVEGVISELEKRIKIRTGLKSSDFFISDVITPYYSIFVEIDIKHIHAILEISTLMDLLSINPKFQLVFDVVENERSDGEEKLPSTTQGYFAAGPYDRCYVSKSLAATGLLKNRQNLLMTK